MVFVAFVVAGIDIISHGPNGVREVISYAGNDNQPTNRLTLLCGFADLVQISFSSTGFTWMAGGVLSIESERTVSISAGTTITMSNPAGAQYSTYFCGGGGGQQRTSFF